MTTQVENSTRSINLIWAQTTSGVIGKDNAMPWHLPEDSMNFRNLTRGKTVVMGRKTWESLPEKVRPLPGRTNIVITRQQDYSAPGALVVSSLEDALEAAPEGQEIWIMGGNSIYTEAEKYATGAVITMIDAKIDGDTYAPPLKRGWRFQDKEGWKTSVSGLRYRITTGKEIPVFRSKIGN